MEIEIKLGPLTEEQGKAIFCDKQRLPGDDAGRDIRMETTYFDDPQGSFKARRQTLRLRQEDEVTLCTFKTALNGLTRLELEAEAATIEQGAGLLSRHPELPQEARTALLAGRFVPVCGARFTRSTRRCAVEGAVFDLCFDRGVLFRGQAHAPLCEVELELAEGDPAILQQVADGLMAAYGARMCPLSKQQRALALEEQA